MADATISTGNAPQGSPKGRSPGEVFAGLWRRMSRRLLPVFAVITALILTIPLMIFAQGDGSISGGLELSRVAYTSLLEGSVGIAINHPVKAGEIDVLPQLAQEYDTNPNLERLTQRDLLALSRLADLMVEVGRSTAQRFEALLEQYDNQVITVVDPQTGRSFDVTLDDPAVDTLGEYITIINQVGEDRLREIFPLVQELAANPTRDLRRLADQFIIAEELEEAGRSNIEARAPLAENFSDETLLQVMAYIRDFRLATPEGTVEGIDRLRIAYDQLLLLDALELSPNGDTARLFEDLFALGTERIPGVNRVRELNQFEALLQQAEIEDVEALAAELRFTNALYSADALTEQDIITALTQELPGVLESTLTLRRPGNRILYYTDGTPEDGVGNSGIIYRDRLLPEGGTRTEPDTVFLRLGDFVLLFFPGNLEQTLTRSIPFIVAALAVGLGFKAGLFNIGAEGQLYAGAIIAVWIGYQDPATSLPVLAVALGVFVGLVAFSLLIGRNDWPPMRRYGSMGAALVVVALATAGLASLLDAQIEPGSSISPVLHMFLVVVGGLVGGSIWGMIPGVLKAFAGAHEVINTIMLNFIAVRLAEWLIKSPDPVIMRDMSASSPRTPFMAESAWLPTFDTLHGGIVVLAGIFTLLLMLFFNRERIQRSLLFALRPIGFVLLVTFIGWFLIWISANGVLHAGFLLMLFAVWFVDWFLERTTLGFELRTVGANPDAARYAGMSVRWNLILALTMSGALAGLAGTIEITGVVHNLQPAFFSGLGFDSIAVALLARNNPRNMIPAGLLWGALLTGAGLMQVNADISINLVKIIQAEIIMFIAADAIIRRLWFVPEATAEEKAASQFSKGWGG